MSPELRMHLMIFLFAAFVSSNSLKHKPDLSPREKTVPYPGPIPYPNPSYERPNPQDVVFNDKHFGLKTDTQTMKDCLVAYGSNQFYDSWAGNVCGGMGWFKGANQNDEMNPYECYETCATYLEGDGFTRGVKDFQCDFRTRVKGHCWMGYHPLPPSSTMTSNLTLPLETSMPDVGTSK